MPTRSRNSAASGQLAANASLTRLAVSYPKIAETFGVREDTVRLWRGAFMDGGIDALKASVAPGPAPVKSEAALRVVHIGAFFDEAPQGIPLSAAPESSLSFARLRALLQTAGSDIVQAIP